MVQHTKTTRRHAATDKLAINREITATPHQPPPATNRQPPATAATSASRHERQRPPWQRSAGCGTHLHERAAERARAWLRNDDRLGTAVGDAVVVLEPHVLAAVAEAERHLEPLLAPVHDLVAEGQRPSAATRGGEGGAPGRRVRRQAHAEG